MIFSKMRLFLQCIFLFFLSGLLDIAAMDVDTIDKENQKGIVALAQLTASEGGEFVSREWGVMTKANSLYENVGFDFVFIRESVNDQKIRDIVKEAHTLYQRRTFELWIENKNKGHDALLKKEGFEHRGDFPGFSLTLDKKMDEVRIPNTITIKTVSNEQEVTDWAKVTASVYKLNKENLISFCKMARSKPEVRFYVGYHEGVPISTRIMLTYGKTVTGYFSATLPEWRRRGVASAVFRYSLNEAQKNGQTLFVNQASPDSTAMWNKMGMKNYGNTYKCYIKQG